MIHYLVAFFVINMMLVLGLTSHVMRDILYLDPAPVSVRLMELGINKSQHVVVKLNQSFTLAFKCFHN